MRVCLSCSKFGARVDSCTDRPRCRIADKGVTIITPGDYIDSAATGKELVEVPPADPTAPPVGDAMYADLTTETTGAFSAPPATFKLSPIFAAPYGPTSVDSIPDPLQSPDVRSRLNDALLKDLMDVATAFKNRHGMQATRAVIKQFASDGKIATVPSYHRLAAVHALAAESRRLGALVAAAEEPAVGDFDPGRIKIMPRVPVTSPDGNPKTAVGVTKPSLHAIPPLALLHLGQAMADGNRKYGLVNWRHDPITMSVYINAIWRHLLALWDGQNVDPTTGIKHTAYIMANCAILLDAEAQGTLNDDRSSIAGKTAELIEQMTRKPEGA